MVQFDLLQFPRATHAGICLALLARGRGIVYSVPVPGVAGGGGQIKNSLLKKLSYSFLSGGRSFQKALKLFSLVSFSFLVFMFTLYILYMYYPSFNKFWKTFTEKLYSKTSQFC